MRPLLYIPTGRAGEYANHGYACNLFHGCDHGCQYCFVPPQKKMDRAKFHASVVAQPNVLARLANDCKKKYAEPIFLCFSCDPYPANEDVRGITREAIRIIVDSGNSVNILTKGGTRAIKDFDLLVKDPRNRIGATITFVDDNLSLEWEPKAALFDDRLEMLSAAKDQGIITWASFEPVIDPSQSIRAMYLAMPYVDEFKVGKWNHDPRAKAINWNEFYDDVSAIMNHFGAKHTFKVDLLEAAGVKGE